MDISEWGAPIVPLLKSNKSSVRICGDFSVTINPVSKLDRYPIPKVADLFTRLSGVCYFTKLDLSHAYQQVPLEGESKKYVVVNTRLLFSVTSAPGIFRRVIESFLQGIGGIIVYFNEILITGSRERDNSRPGRRC